MKRNVDVVRAFAAIVSAALFSVIFAVLASSCTENGASHPPVEKKKDAILRLDVAGALTANGRATGTIPTKEDNIKTLAVGVFDASDGSVNVIAECTVENNQVKDDILCSAGLCDVIVVANAPAGTFEGVQSKNEFLQKTVLLSQTATKEGVQNADNLPMSGQIPEPTEFIANTVNEVPVTLTRLVARISIESIRTAFKAGSNNAKATFTLDKVFLSNALSMARIAPGDATLTMPVTPSWLDGGHVAGDNSWMPGEKYLLNEITPVVLSGIGVNEYTIPNWFYAFANNDQNHSTKVVIGGYYDPDGSTGPEVPTYVYYPIVVNQYAEGTEFPGSEKEDHNGTIARNTEYRLRATIAKEGVATPDEEIVNGAMQLTVSVADWKLTIDQEVDIQ